MIELCLQVRALQAEARWEVLTNRVTDIDLTTRHHIHVEESCLICVIIEVFSTAMVAIT